MSAHSVVYLLTFLSQPLWIAATWYSVSGRPRRALSIILCLYTAHLAGAFLLGPPNEYLFAAVISSGPCWLTAVLVCTLIPRHSPRS